MIFLIFALPGGKNGEDFFAVLYDEHSAQVRRVISRLTPDNALIDDLVQETFLKAWKAQESLKDQKVISSWICSIAVNATKDHFRTKEGKREKKKVSVDDELISQSDEMSVSASQGDQLDGARLVKEALDILPLEQRAVVVLHLYEGFSMEEAGQSLGIPAGTVKSRYFNAKKSMKDFLQKKGLSLEDV